MKSLTSALVRYEKITTTEAKAKELRPLIERMVTYTKKSDLLHARRLLARHFAPELAMKLMKEIGPRYSARHGGYTRIVKVPPRARDHAKMAIIEFIK